MPKQNIRGTQLKLLGDFMNSRGLKCKILQSRVYILIVPDEPSNEVAVFTGGPAIGKVTEEDSQETSFEPKNLLSVKDYDAEIQSEDDEKDEQNKSKEDLTTEEINIIRFLKTRKFRPNMASYVLSEDDNKKIAAHYLSSLPLSLILKC